MSRELDETFCYVHDTPPLSSEEEALIEEEHGDMDAVCIFLKRVDV